MNFNSKAIKTVAVVTAAALFIAAGVFAFCALQGKYAFMSEPQLQRPSLSLEKKPLSERQPLESRLFWDQLATDAQLEAYDAVVQHALAVDDGQFWLDNANSDDLQIAVSAFRGDYPEVFWLDPQAPFRYYEEDDGVTAQLCFTETGDELDADVLALGGAVEAVAAGAPDGADDFEIEQYINNWLIGNCVYTDETADNHSAYGALVMGQAVCDGYSRAFQLLCRRLGVECTVVEGTSEFNDEAENGHMWNCVQLGGSWYHVDVTWNDASEAVCDAERVFYLNLSEEEILRDHVIGGSFTEDAAARGDYYNIFVPACNSDALNYMRLNFVRIGDPEDDAPILASLLAAARQRQTYCAFVLDESADFAALARAITEKYAARWVQGANRFLNGDLTLAANGSIVTYESKRVLVILPEYRE